MEVFWLNEQLYYLCLVLTVGELRFLYCLIVKEVELNGVNDYKVKDQGTN